jgi:hypothetical protein
MLTDWMLTYWQAGAVIVGTGLGCAGVAAYAVRRSFRMGYEMGWRGHQRMLASLRRSDPVRYTEPSRRVIPPLTPPDPGPRVTSGWD